MDSVPESQDETDKGHFHKDNNFMKCTQLLKSLGSVSIFERSLLCLPILHLFGQKKSHIVKYYDITIQFKITVFYFNIFENVIYSWVDTAEFSAAVTSVSHIPTEIIIICRFAAQETFLIIIHIENSCAARYFCEKHDTFVHDSSMNRTAIICNIINVFTVIYCGLAK